jgi:hypothetical protein
MADKKDDMWVVLMDYEKVVLMAGWRAVDSDDSRAVELVDW